MITQHRTLGSVATCAKPTMALSSVNQLRQLLSEIDQTAASSDGSFVAGEELSRIRRRLQSMDESTAGILLDAIRLGEDFAYLYFEDFPQNAAARWAP